MSQKEDLYKRCEMMQKRQTAYKVKIKDLLDGIYVKEAGEWTPNYIEINEKKVSRANIIGAVVLKQDAQGANHSNIILDDGSGKISVRGFDKDDFFRNVDVGDVVLLVGRPRQFGSEKYVVPEILKRIENKRWIDVRKLELKLNQNNKENKNEVNGAAKAVEIESIEESPGIKIVQLVKSLDPGDGADINNIISKSERKDAEKIIQNLLEEGEIFEVRSGKLKVLE